MMIMMLKTKDKQCKVVDEDTQLVALMSVGVAVARTVGYSPWGGHKVGFNSLPRGDATGQLA